MATIAQTVRLLEIGQELTVTTKTKAQTKTSTGTLVLSVTTEYLIGKESLTHAQFNSVRKRVKLVRIEDKSNNFITTYKLRT